MEFKKEISSEGGHWYTETGVPAYEVQGKDGQWRKTTLRDARKQNLVPSVTTILGILAKPGLESWKLQNTVLAALTLPRLKGESDDDFAIRVVQDSKKQAQEAASLGTSIHASLDKFYSGESYPQEHEIYVSSVSKAILEKYGERQWIAEKSFAHPRGFGGKVDLACNAIVIDFKTTSGDVTKAGYDEHLIQLAAYAAGLGTPDATLANVYVNTSTGKVHIKEWTKDEAIRGNKIFSFCLDLWQIHKDYSPCKQNHYKRIIDLFISL